jgi:hypothetical protein
MSTNIPHDQEDQEIDIFQVFNKIGKFFERINTKIFKSIQFVLKNAVLILILFGVGMGLGYYLDKSNTSYDNQIIVAPNFESTNYLYSKISLLNTKITEGDLVFFKEVVGIKEPANLKKIQIKPITDVYTFVQSKAENLELLKLMAENGEINKIIEEDITSKNYPYHLITFSSSKLTNKSEITEPLLKYLNDSQYYTKVQKVYVANIKEKMTQNDSIISQINQVLNAFGNTTKGVAKSSNLVYYNENTQLNDLIKTKEELINEKGVKKLALVSYDKIVKDISVTLNSKKFSGINGKLKVILPVLFFLLFIVLSLFKAFYKKQLDKSNAN